MCPRCETFAERQRFDTPTDYVAFVRTLIDQTSNGCLALIYGNCALDDLKDAPPWPTGDIIYHEFQCATCGQYFALTVNVDRKSVV